MSVLNSILEKINDHVNFSDQKSIEQKEIERLFPKLKEVDTFILSKEFETYKKCVSANKDLTFIDFVDDVNGIKRLDRKPLFTQELKNKSNQSNQSTLNSIK